jgi:hypothetical protein
LRFIRLVDPPISDADLLVTGDEKTSVEEDGASLGLSVTGDGRSSKGSSRSEIVLFGRLSIERDLTGRSWASTPMTCDLVSTMVVY